jgi:hypothetical protein
MSCVLLSSPSIAMSVGIASTSPRLAALQADIARSSSDVLLAGASLREPCAGGTGATRSCTAATVEVSIDCVTAACTCVCNSTANIETPSAAKQRIDIAANINARANRAPTCLLLLMSLVILSSKILPSKMLNMNACDEYWRDTSAAQSSERA